MSSKFFTWTKGDRKHAADAFRVGGFVPITSEYIAVHGMEHERDVKVSFLVRETNDLG